MHRRSINGRTRRRAMSFRQAGIRCIIVAIMASAGGCGDGRIDESKLYQGMDRSSIIAHFGSPDARKTHDNVERLTYKDGDNYQYLILLIDGKLETWHHDRIYKANRFSNIRGRDKNN